MTPLVIYCSVMRLVPMDVEQTVLENFGTMILRRAAFARRLVDFGIVIH